MKSYLSLIPISARAHRRQNRMTRLCIIFAVFMVTAIFSMAEMGTRMEQTRLAQKHGGFSLWDLFGSAMGQTLLLVAAVLFLLVLAAGVLMISGSLHSSVAQRTQFFGMMRCIGMSRQQIARFVRLEALNWCKTAIPAGLVLGIAVSWILCAVLRFWVGEEFSSIPLFGISGHRHYQWRSGGHRDGVAGGSGSCPPCGQCFPRRCCFSQHGKQIRNLPYLPNRYSPH